jgi:hypothetical protein
MGEIGKVLGEAISEDLSFGAEVAENVSGAVIDVGTGLPVISRGDFVLQQGPGKSEITTCVSVTRKSDGACFDHQEP